MTPCAKCHIHPRQFAWRGLDDLLRPIFGECPGGALTMQ